MGTTFVAKVLQTMPKCFSDEKYPNVWGSAPVD
jgi:hypothetical protein